MTVQFGKLSSSMFVIRQGTSQGIVTTSVTIGQAPPRNNNNPYCDNDANQLPAEGSPSAGDAFVVEYSNMQGGVVAEVPANAKSPASVQFRPHPTAGRLLTESMPEADKQELARGTPVDEGQAEASAVTVH